MGALSLFGKLYSGSGRLAYVDKTAYNFELTPEGVEGLLAGPMVAGIGPAFARKLVDRFGVEAVNVLCDHPEEARVIPGLGEAKIAAAAESIARISQPIPFIAFLYQCGISDMFIERILAKYRKRAPEVVATDPYSMVEDVWQLSFFTADKIGREMGIAPADTRRLQAALVSAVKRYAEDGHLFATPDQAVEAAARMAAVDVAQVQAAVQPTVQSGRLVESRSGLYLPVFYKAEKEGAARLMQLAAEDVEAVPVDQIPIHDRQGHTFSPAQRAAIAKAVNNPVAVLTGGPGSGKTTVLKGVIDIFTEQGKKIVLAAPTGRAAKRMTTLTGLPASTIHSLLGYRQGEGYRKKALETDVLIIDEGSMMEQVLFNHLLETLRPGTRIILVGDVDQLPAIGAGDVLRDLIASGAVPVARLSENFRQKAGSLIAAGARSINTGTVPASDIASDFMIIPAAGPQKIHDRIIELVTREIPQTRGIDPRDITVVTPQQIGSLGARALNADLQAAINPEGPEIVRGGTVMRLGDPVMQRTNSSQRGIYNGEVGRIIDVDPLQRRLTVQFSDGRTSVYTTSELAELVPAYATTVHKLQGSEVPFMVFVVPMAHKPMLYRNLLYTGVSRASDLCVIVGEEEALRYAIANNPANTRNSNFRHRLAAPKDI